MIESVYIAVQVLAFILLIASFFAVDNNRRIMLGVTSFFLLAYLSFASFNIQVVDCDTVLSNSTLTSNVTVYEYNNSGCSVNGLADRHQSWFNMGSAILVLAYSVGLMLVNWKTGLR